MAEKKKNTDRFLTIVFSIISVIYLIPIALVVLNSFTKKAYISR